LGGLIDPVTPTVPPPFAQWDDRENTPRLVYAMRAGPAPLGFTNGPSQKWSIPVDCKCPV